MTPDELVHAIFSKQMKDKPNEDPGDITIDIQDDSAAHIVLQKNKIIGMGNSIQSALQSAYDQVYL